MYTVGKRYTIEIIEAAGARTISDGWLVTRVDGPLIEIEPRGATKILNTHSPAFVGSRESADQSGELPLLVLPDWLEQSGAAAAN